MKLAWPREPSSGSTGGHHHVDVGDASVGDPGLGPVDDPLVFGLVVDGPGAQRAHVGPGIGLGHGERSHLDLLGSPEALGPPLAELLGCPVGDDARQPQGAAEDGEPDPGVTPRQLLVGDRHHQPPGSKKHWVMKSKEYSPIRAASSMIGHGVSSPLVPFVGRRSDDILREVVDPLLDLQLVFAEIERELGHFFPSVQAPTGPMGPGRHGCGVSAPVPECTGTALTYPLLLNGNLWTAVSTTIRVDVVIPDRLTREKTSAPRGRALPREGGAQAEQLVGQAPDRRSHDPGQRGEPCWTPRAAPSFGAGPGPPPER